LIFKLNDNEVLKKSGEIPWTEVAFPVGAGMNKMEWTYSKDQSVSNGADCAWLDLIDFAESSPVSYITKDLQVARIVTPVQKDKYGREIVTVKVLNTGRDTVKGFKMAYMVNNQGSPVTQSFDNIITPYSDSVAVSFSTRADLSKYGKYNIVTYAYDNKDDYPSNDTLRIYLENNQLTDSISAYPNPFTHQITLFVQSVSDDIINISFINNSGVKCYEMEKSIVSGKNYIVISDVSLSPALYYLRIKGSTMDNTIPVINLRK
jgi:hypothetical protein